MSGIHLSVDQSIYSAEYADKFEHMYAIERNLIVSTIKYLEDLMEKKAYNAAMAIVVSMVEIIHIDRDTAYAEWMLANKLDDLNNLLRHASELHDAANRSRTMKMMLG